MWAHPIVKCSELQKKKENPGLWAVALLAPSLLLLWRLFRITGPAEYLSTLYLADPAGLVTLPVLALLVACAYAWVSRRAVTAGAGFGFILFFFSCLLLFGGGLALNLLAAAFGLVILVAAAGAGLRLLALPGLEIVRSRVSSALELLVLAAALGLGLLALAVFLLGSFGLLSAWFWWPALLLLCAAGATPLRPLAKELARNWPRQEDGGFSVAVGAFLAIWVLFHLLLLWAPPLDYDTLEYHLAGPAQYLRAGRISFLFENVLANMPQAGEMLYLLAMVLAAGHKLRALPGAHLLSFAAWLLSIALVYVITARLTRPRSPSGSELQEEKATPAPMLAALIYALIPLGSQLLADFFVEHFQALFHLAALLAACIFLDERRAGVRSRTAWLLVCGCFAGLACATKYPAIIFTLLPLAFYLGLFCALSGAPAEGLHAAALVAASAATVLSPWLARNIAAAGDPLYPLGPEVNQHLAGGRAKLTPLDFFKQAIRPYSGLRQTLKQLLPSLSPREDWTAWARDTQTGPQLLCFVLPGVLALKREAALLVAAVFATDGLLWLFCTHRLIRFLYPLLAPMAILAGLGLARLWLLAPLRKAALALLAAAVLTLCPLTLFSVWLYSRPEFVEGAEAPEEAARKQYCMLGNPAWFEGWRALNALPPGSKALLLGEAQTYYLDKTPVYSVFARSPLQDALAQPSVRASAQYLAALGVTHLYINYAEWFRLDWPYAVRVGKNGGWEHAVLEASLKEKLRSLLTQGQFAAYGLAWPEDVYHAYLPLTKKEYARLEEVLRKYTVVEWQANNANGSTKCEIRKIVLRMDK